jgi:hypothetical protein
MDEFVCEFYPSDQVTYLRDIAKPVQVIFRKTLESIFRHVCINAGLKKSQPLR